MKNLVQENLCKFYRYNFDYLSQTKIVGGMETGVNEYPMMAGLVDPDQREVYCGSAIISQRHVLTAAHCVADRNANRVGVLVGDHDLTTGIYIYIFSTCNFILKKLEERFPCRIQFHIILPLLRNLYHYLICAFNLFSIQMN